MIEDTRGRNGEGVAPDEPVPETSYETRRNFLANHLPFGKKKEEARRALLDDQIPNDEKETGNRRKVRYRVVTGDNSEETKEVQESLIDHDIEHGMPPQSLTRPRAQTGFENLQINITEKLGKLCQSQVFASDAKYWFGSAFFATAVVMVLYSVSGNAEEHQKRIRSTNSLENNDAALAMGLLFITSMTALSVGAARLGYTQFVPADTRRYISHQLDQKASRTANWLQESGASASDFLVSAAKSRLQKMHDASVTRAGWAGGVTGALGGALFIAAAGLKQAENAAVFGSGGAAVGITMIQSTLFGALTFAGAKALYNRQYDQPIGGLSTIDLSNTPLNKAQQYALKLNLENRLRSLNKEATTTDFNRLVASLLLGYDPFESSSEYFRYNREWGTLDKVNTNIEIETVRQALMASDSESSRANTLETGMLPADHSCHEVVEALKAKGLDLIKPWESLKNIVLFILENLKGSEFKLGEREKAFGSMMAACDLLLKLSEEGTWVSAVSDMPQVDRTLAELKPALIEFAMEGVARTQNSINGYSDDMQPLYEAQALYDLLASSWPETDTTWPKPTVASLSAAQGVFTSPKTHEIATLDDLVDSFKGLKAIFDTTSGFSNESHKLSEFLSKHGISFPAKSAATPSN